MYRLISASCVSLVTLMTAVGCERPKSPSGAPTGEVVSSEATSPLVGMPAPEIKGTRLDGEPFDLQEKLGSQVTMLSFWATWCGPCILEIPILQKIAEEFKSKGVALYAVNQGEDAETIRNFLSENNWQLEVVLDPQDEICQKYGVQGIPQLVLIDGKGIVKHVHVGYHAEIERELRHELDELLSGK